jgi:hypothetical protein
VGDDQEFGRLAQALAAGRYYAGAQKARTGFADDAVTAGLELDSTPERARTVHSVHLTLPLDLTRTLVSRLLTDHSSSRRWAGALDRSFPAKGERASDRVIGRSGLR